MFKYENSPEMDHSEPGTKPAAKPAGTFLTEGTENNSQQQQQQPPEDKSGATQRDGDQIAEAFYSESQQKEIGEGLDPLFAEEGIDPFDKTAVADQQERRTRAIQSAHAVGFTRQDVTTLAQMLPEYSAMDESGHLNRRQETFEAYKRERPDDYETDLKLAREYLSQPKHKVIADWLAVTGIANDIRTVRRSVELARRWAMKGKPK